MTFAFLGNSDFAAEPDVAVFLAPLCTLFYRVHCGLFRGSAEVFLSLESKHIFYVENGLEDFRGIEVQHGLKLMVSSADVVVVVHLFLLWFNVDD